MASLPGHELPWRSATSERNSSHRVAWIDFFSGRSAMACWRSDPLHIENPFPTFFDLLAVLGMGQRVLVVALVARQAKPGQLSSRTPHQPSRVSGRYQ